MAVPGFQAHRRARRRKRRPPAGGSSARRAASAIAGGGNPLGPTLYQPLRGTSPAAARPRASSRHAAPDLAPGRRALGWPAGALPAPKLAPASTQLRAMPVAGRKCCSFCMLPAVHAELPPPRSVHASACPAMQGAAPWRQSAAASSSPTRGTCADRRLLGGNNLEPTS